MNLNFIKYAKKCFQYEQFQDKIMLFCKKNTAHNERFC